MIKNYLNEQKGIMISDVIIAILVILLFGGVITSLMYNIVLESAKTKANSQEIDLATEIFEDIEKSAFSDVTEENIISFINDRYDPNQVTAGKSIESLNSKYKIMVTVTPYSELEGNEDKLDLIKIIELKIQIEINNKPYITEMSTVKKATMDEVNDIIGN